jgi:hypothetical protein
MIKDIFRVYVKLAYMAIFLALWVWEGTGAIQDDKYLKW